MTTQMPAGWYEDPFTDDLMRYWNGTTWTKDTRPRIDLNAPPAPNPSAPSHSAPTPTGSPLPVTGARGTGIPDYLIPSILAIIFCFWPLAIPAVYFAVKANRAGREGRLGEARQLADRARLFLGLSVVIGIALVVLLVLLMSSQEVAPLPE